VIGRRLTAAAASAGVSASAASPSASPSASASASAKAASRAPEPAVDPHEPLFDLRGIRYVYGRRQVALDGIDLRIDRGEHVALLGANGSGKSTLLKLLDGIVAPTAGSMRALGRDVAAIANGRDAFRFHREVGLVFQDPDIQLFSATVRDDVAFGPLQLGLPLDDVRAAVDGALAQMEIAHLGDRAPFELSGGEKKRAAIASVLSLGPEVLLLDEPTASLDPRTKWVLVNLIRRLAEGGTTLVTATHELDIVPIIARRVVVLGEHRRVLADGPTDDILADRDLLIRANLIHEHLHEHFGVSHAHEHDSEHHGAGEAMPGAAMSGGAGPGAARQRPAATARPEAPEAEADEAVE
jgi:cobalt/nickel transport system ATP-binding protein